MSDSARTNFGEFSLRLRVTSSSFAAVGAGLNLGPIGPIWGYQRS
jgi:hypothetical protein